MTSAAYFWRGVIPGAEEIVLGARDLVHSHPCSRYHASVRRMPSRRKAESAGRIPARLARAQMSNARLFVKKSTRRRYSGGAMPKRRAQGLAQRARNPDRPDRELQRGRPNARFFGDDGNQLVQCGDLAACQDVGSIGRGRHFAAQPEPFDEVVDVRQMIKDVSRPKHHKSAAARRP